MMSILRGLLSLFLYIITLLGLAVVVLFLFFIAFLMPFPKWRRYVRTNLLHQIPVCFARINRWISLISTRKNWDILGAGELKNEGWYVMMSNHRTWLDIIVLGNAFDKKIPPLKFFMKKELLWQLPLAGLACYALGYPFMSRHSHAQVRKNPALKGKDIETTKKACAHLKQFPTTLINFLEGTRFTEKKKERQQSPFRHLLKPHTAGVAVAINEMKDSLSGIVNVTICYPKKTPTVWEYACGKFEKIIVRYEVLPITPNLIGDYHNDRVFRSNMQQWLNTLWQEKDALIERLS